MIELQNNNIAVSSNSKNSPIFIINCVYYDILKVIEMEEFITSSSSLCVLDEFSFIYVFEGNLLQISTKDFSIIYKKKGGKFSGYWGGMIPFKEGFYLVIENEYDLSFVKPYYSY